MPRLPRLPRPSVAVLVLTAVLLALANSPAPALRLVSWNILNFPGSTGAAREPDYRTVLAQVAPDVIVAQELLSSSGATQFLNNVLNVLEPGQWAMAPYVNGPDTDNACYYRIAAVDYVSMVTLPTALRYINGYVLRPDGYTSAGAQFRVYSLHLKASQGTDNEAKRLAEATILRNHLNALATGTPVFVGGDYNIYDSGEPAWGKLTGSEADNDGRTFDPINRVGTWHNNASYADIHTQSTRVDQLGDGGSNGGMDDRFDMFLGTSGILDGEGIAYIPATYEAIGQDGLHFNKAINASPPNTAVGTSVANALHDASDHLPLSVDVQLPARMVVGGDLEFGRILVGTPTSGIFAVQNIAATPADDLDYSVQQPAGFVVAPLSGSLAAGEFDLPTVQVDVDSPAEFSGSVVVLGDAPDEPSRTLDASATVLSHAVPSVSAASAVVSGGVDFGSAEAGDFVDQDALVYNFGFDSLTALLDVYDYQVSGVDAARFDVTDFSPVDVGATPAAFTVHFDDGGSEEETLYEATLVFSTRDEQGAAGAADLSDLSFALSAYVEKDATSVPDISRARNLLLPASPNPFNPRTSLRFELARAGHADLRIYNARGQLVRVLLGERRDAGPHAVIWDGRSDSGSPVASGVYHYRLRSGDFDQTRRMTLVR